jgi:hypothetical protein
MPYLIVFGILIIGVLIWQARQSKLRIFNLSKQVFPELNLLTLTSKKEGKIREVIVRTNAKKEITIRQVNFELISPKREFIYIPSTELAESVTLPHLMHNETILELSFPYERLKETMKEKMPVMNSFRVVLELDNGKVFKSHELTISKYWNIHKADTGKYN